MKIPVVVECEHVMCSLHQLDIGMGRYKRQLCHWREVHLSTISLLELHPYIRHIYHIDHQPHNERFFQDTVQWNIVAALIFAFDFVQNLSNNKLYKWQTINSVQHHGVCLLFASFFTILFLTTALNTWLSFVINKSIIPLNICRKCQYANWCCKSCPYVRERESEWSIHETNDHHLIAKTH